jgi:hypothetical protein
MVTTINARENKDLSVLPNQRVIKLSTQTRMQVVMRVLRVVWCGVVSAEMNAARRMCEGVPSSRQVIYSPMPRV